jgi:hypothetical protein
MPRRATVTVNATVNQNMFAMRGGPQMVETLSGVLYQLYIDAFSDLVYVKSTNGGLTWSNPVVLFAGTVEQHAVWYDRWSGISADLIHYVYTESATNDDVFYRTINTASSDALSTQTTVMAFTSATAAGGGTLSLTRSRGGIVYCRACVDAGAEGGFAHLVNANVPNGAWASRTIDEAVADNDDIVLMPGFAADADDIIAIFLDASANTLSRKLFDASGNSWSESDINTGYTEPLPETHSSNFAVVPDLDNSQLYVVMWTQADLANADLLCYTVTESAITAVGDVITNSTDDQGMTALALDVNTGNLYCAYGGASGGAQTFPTAITFHYKVSTDSGATWGSEQSLDTPVDDYDGLFCNLRLISQPFGVMMVRNDVPGTETLLYTPTIAQPSVTGNIGI